MQIGLFAPAVYPAGTPEYLRTIGTVAEERDFHSLWKARNPRRTQPLVSAPIIPTDHSLPALRRSASQAGRRRFDPGRPRSRNFTAYCAFRGTA
jgi:hypothetical protein